MVTATDDKEPTDAMQKLADAAEGLWKDGALVHMVRMLNPKRIPAMMEFEVPELSPYLITSSSALFWIPKARGGRVRAGVRPKSTTAEFFAEVIEEVAAQGIQSEWGNVHPLTAEGIKAAVAHVHYYMADEEDHSQLLILASPELDWSTLDPTWSISKNHFLAELFGAPVAKADWLDPGTVVVIPQNRGLVGFAVEVGEEHILSIIHNASRGIGVARGKLAG